MNRKLSAEEQIELVKQIYSMLKLLHDEEALAGVVLTSSSYDGFRRVLADSAIPYKPSEVDIDPAMEHSFVVGGLLIMRGTQLQ